MRSFTSFTFGFFFWGGFYFWPSARGGGLLA